MTRFNRLKNAVIKSGGVSGYVNENGFNVIQYSQKDRDELFNEINSEIPNHILYTPNDKLPYWIISSTDNHSTIEVNNKRYTVKHNWSNYQSKIYAKVRSVSK